jgi:hypothetical protein
MGMIEDIARRLSRNANVSAAVNVAKGEGAHTTVRRHQRIVQRDGETTVTVEEHTDREEHHHGREA